MKLISKGNKIKNLFRGECRNCGARFEAERAELKVDPGTQREPGEFAWGICSECHKGPYGGVLFYPVETAAGVK